MRREGERGEKVIIGHLTVCENENESDGDGGSIKLSRQKFFFVYAQSMEAKKKFHWL